MKIAIRREEPDDGTVLREVLRRVFKRQTEANLVDALRQTCSERILLVANADNVAVGCALFTPVTIRGPKRTIRGMGLAPIAVHPEFQREGIGSLLVESGINLLKRNACPFVVTFGIPSFFERFGFVRAGQYNIQCPWRKIPDDSFLLIILNSDVMTNVSGIASFKPEFEMTV